eukprot:TRINITY_DN47465_c0_g1_i1.p1 TRINITY_DN47465_c0_g1~~TRINITY_DN47465_c0_g1_i1.p1  ORF type:complete len:231 (+),score=67.69 TRINITY_DN47465_c0_g1_i1:253-945(+)
MGGGGRGGKKGKGKGFGGGPYERRGPVLEAPPLYPPDRMPSVPPVEFPFSREDIMLIEGQRRLLCFWKTSVYYMQGGAIGGDAAPGAASGGAVGNGAQAGPGAAGTLPSKAELDVRMREIISGGDLSEHFFPQELCLKQQLRIRGKANEKNILDALKRMEGKEARGAAAAAKRAEQGQDGEEKDRKAGDDAEEEAPEEDEDFGDDDYIEEHGDVEDGMGNDFDDDGGGDD